MRPAGAFISATALSFCAQNDARMMRVSIIAAALAPSHLMQARWKCRFFNSYVNTVTELCVRIMQTSVLKILPIKSHQNSKYNIPLRNIVKQYWASIWKKLKKVMGFFFLFVCFSAHEQQTAQGSNGRKTTQAKIYPTEQEPADQLSGEHHGPCVRACVCDYKSRYTHSKLFKEGGNTE